MDPDFQEKMFSRQMAVMKGQAWNVVETLKMADHGPLELTRRAKVCVWDDLIDVPTAVPMQVTSTDRRRAAESGARHSMQEEMDIGAANSTSAPTAAKQQVDDLLGSYPSPLPNPGRFELTSPSTEAPDSPDLQAQNVASQKPAAVGRDSLDATAERKGRPHPAQPRSSYQGPSRTQTKLSASRGPRRFSFASGRRHGTNSIAGQLHGTDAEDPYGGYHGYDYDIDDEDMDGDLGYAAAEGMEGNRRKVIVERLETVKSRNPVFTWC